MENPAEKTAVRPNQNPSAASTLPRIDDRLVPSPPTRPKLVRRIRPVMKSIFILIADRHTRLDGGPQFHDDSN